MECPYNRASEDLGNIVALEHVNVTVPDQQRSLIKKESDQHQYHFENIVDPASGETVFMIEPEVRSMKHPLFMRPLVNRDPGPSNLNYAPGHQRISVGNPVGLNIACAAPSCS